MAHIRNSRLTFASRRWWFPRIIPKRRALATISHERRPALEEWSVAANPARRVSPSVRSSRPDPGKRLNPLQFGFVLRGGRLSGPQSVTVGAIPPPHQTDRSQRASPFGGSRAKPWWGRGQRPGAFSHSALGP